MSPYHHTTLSSNVSSVLRRGLQPSKYGNYGSGIYLRPPHVDPEEFGLFHMRGQDTSILAVTLRKKIKTLKVDANAPNHALHVLRLLYGHEAGAALYDKMGLFHFAGENFPKADYINLNKLVAEEGYDGVEAPTEVLLLNPRLIKSVTLVGSREGGYSLRLATTYPVLSSTHRIQRDLRKVTDRVLDEMSEDGWWFKGKLRHDRPTEWHINTGLCEEWALLAKKAVGGEDVDVDGVLGTRGRYNHVVLHLDGRYYDSQHPEGVEDLRDLDLVKGVSLEKFLSRQNTGRHAKIVAPPRDIKKYFRMFGKMAKTLKPVLVGLEKLDQNQSGSDWVSDSTSREVDPYTLKGGAGRLIEDLLYMAEQEESIEIFPDSPRKVIRWASDTAVRLRETVEYLSRSVEDLHRYKSTLEEELEYYEGVSKVETNAIYFWLSREWASYSKMMIEAEAKLQALLVEPVPEKVETLYHASAEAKVLLRKGFTPGGPQKSGLGGAVDGKDGKNAISFSHDLYICKEIARTFKEAALIAQGKVKASHVLRWAEKAGFKDDVVSTAKSTWSVQGDIEQTMAYWVAYLTYAGSKGKRYNPVFWHNPIKLVQLFKGVNYRDIGVLEAEVNMEDPAISYHRAEREYRVPVKAIRRLVRVI